MEFIGYEEGSPVYLRFLELPSATPFHTISWLRFVRTILPGSKIRFLVWHEGGYPSGIMPIVERRFLFVRAGYSVPFDAPGGPLGSPAPRDWHKPLSDYWRVRICDPEGVLTSPWSLIRVPVHLIDTARFSPSRSQIKATRQAERRGLSLERISGFSEEIYGLYCKVKAIKGGLRFGLRAMEALFTEMSGHILGFIARHEGRAVAFILNFFHNQRAVSYLHGFDREFAGLRPMSALIMRSVESARDMGITEFSLGSTTPGDKGQAAFKESFGAVPKPMNIHIKRGIFEMIPKRRDRTL
ncbi:MAG: GNAT family N-acetyltransferase [candidate division WOR-3 bacterium]